MIIATISPSTQAVGLALKILTYLALDAGGKFIKYVELNLILELSLYYFNSRFFHSIYGIS